MRMVTSPPIGRFIDVGVRGLWMRQVGAGDVPVVFVPGAGGFGLDFFLAQELVAKFAPSLIYDRAGTGWSDDVSLPRSTDDVTDELRALLKCAAVPTPCIFVGHSLGGAYVQRYAQRFPEDVAGLLLLEPLHEDYNDYMPENLKFSANEGGAQDMPELPADVVAHIRGAYTEMFADFPQDMRKDLIDRHLGPERLPTGFREGLNVLAVLQQLRHGGPRPDVPVIVLSTNEIDPSQEMFASESRLREQIEASKRLFAAIASKATQGEHRVVAGASHVSLPIKRADCVAEAAAQLIERVSSRSRSLKA